MPASRAARAIARSSPPALPAKTGYPKAATLQILPLIAARRFIPTSQCIQRWRYQRKVRIPGESRDPLIRRGAVDGWVPAFAGAADFLMFSGAERTHIRRSDSTWDDSGITGAAVSGP